MSNSALIDSQAGSAFYWFVQPCRAGNRCAPLAHAANAFNKLSNGVELTSPANGASVSNAVTLSWKDYLATNSDATPGKLDETGVSSRIEAKQYRVELSTTPNFQSLFESATVDQTTYTSYGNTYPEGLMYWRVQAIDGSGNRLAYSPIWSFTKSSPTVRPASPMNGVSVSGTQPFVWTPLDFAGSYDVEVFKDGDTTGSSVKRVVSGNSKQVAFSLTSPLPAASTPYTWHVRRVDAKGRKGEWSPLTLTSSFKVVGNAPTLTAPTSGRYVTGNDALFTWKAADGATSYSFERRAAGSTSLAERVTTAALAWAPTKTIPDGSWLWRVTSLDASGKALASSPWWSFAVDGTRPRVTAKSPTGTVKRTTNFAVRFSEPVRYVSTKTMRIYLAGRSTPLRATVSVNRYGTAATLNPSANLKPGKYYVVRVTSGIRDRAGHTLVATSWKVRAK
jgi:hypothetical protein